MDSTASEGKRDDFIVMKLIIVELFSNITLKFRNIEAIIDTGASKTTIAAHITEELGISTKGSLLHHWQANCPVIGTEIPLKIRYKSSVYNIKANCIEIEGKYLRNIQPTEECTRPEYFHPLKYRILLGLDFIDSISQKDKFELFGLIIK